MIIPGAGLPLYNCNNGDLILSFILTPHRYIKVKSNHLYTSVEITLKESLIGFIKGITQLDSRLITITSESIIKPNMIKCIENEGLAEENTNKLGNLYVKFKIIYPDSLTSEQKKCIIELVLIPGSLLCIICISTRSIWPSPIKHYSVHYNSQTKL